MKKLSIVALAYGLVVGSVSTAGFLLLWRGHAPVTEWFATALAEQGSSIDLWRFHWVLTCTSFGLISVAAFVLGVFMWRNSATAAKIWLTLTVSVLVVGVLLFIFRPLPFAFQDVSILDIGIQSAVLIFSGLVYARVERQRNRNA